jgi:sec-independent protein translocase protein TatC
VGFIISYIFASRIFEILMKPWIAALPEGHQATLIYTAPHEAFFVNMKVAFIAGTLLAVPVIVWQIWQFIAPGLYANEKKYMLPVSFFSALCFISGGLFGYFVVFPAAFKFFASFATEHITPLVTATQYLALTNKMLLCFGLAFELPVFAFFLAKLGLVSSDFLRRKRKIAIVLIFILAAVLSPTPDVISQLLMAGPMLVLYEASVWIVYFFASKPFRSDEKAGTDTPA